MPRTPSYSLAELLADIARNAEVDRAAKWLELAADDYPAIFGIIRENLNKPPAVVLRGIVDTYPMIGFGVIAVGTDKAEKFIQRLQAFYKERGY